MNIILCGMPMCGKSTLAPMLAQKLEKIFIDTDHELEKTYAKAVGETLSCREISIRLGEPAFRRWENFVIEGIQGVTNSIIATGGGSLCHHETAQILKSLGTIVYLQVPSQVLIQRLMQKSALPAYLNPLDPIGSFEELSKYRCQLYEKFADTRIDASSTDLEEVISRICSSIEKERAYGQQ